MANYDQRLKALEQQAEPHRELPMIVNDKCSDEEIKRLQRNGRKVYRESDPELMEEFI